MRHNVLGEAANLGKSAERRHLWCMCEVTGLRARGDQVHSTIKSNLMLYSRRTSPLRTGGRGETRIYLQITPLLISQSGSPPPSEEHSSPSGQRKPIHSVNGEKCFTNYSKVMVILPDVLNSILGVDRFLRSPVSAKLDICGVRLRWLKYHIFNIFAIDFHEDFFHYPKFISLTSFLSIKFRHIPSSKA